MTRSRLTSAAAVLAVALAVSGCGGSKLDGPPPMHAVGSAATLRALLAAAHVPLGRGKHPQASSFVAAWAAFQRFELIPVDQHDLSGNQPNDDLLFELGVLETTLWGTSLELDLARQYALAGGDLQQAHLIVHFPATAFVPLTRGLRATPCVPGKGCAFGCFFADDAVIVPHPCQLVPRGAGGYRVRDFTLRASQTDAPTSEQHARWITEVDSFAAFRRLLTRHVRPDGFEVRQASAE
jgi:hypothetical protein